jgi:hypothetical protein
MTIIYRSLTHTDYSPQSVTVSTSRFLATDFNTGTVIGSLNYTIQISYIQSSSHGRTFATDAFLQSLPYRTEISTSNCVDCPSFLQDNSSVRATQKTQPLYWCRYVFTTPLHSNGRAADHIENIVRLLRACMLRSLPSNDHCLHSLCLATGLYATIICIYAYIFN